jgi:hypothetical protein
MTTFKCMSIVGCFVTGLCTEDLCSGGWVSWMMEPTPWPYSWPQLLTGQTSGTVAEQKVPTRPKGPALVGVLSSLARGEGGITCTVVEAAKAILPGLAGVVQL